MHRYTAPILTALFAAGLLLGCVKADAQAVKTELVHEDGAWKLLRGGKPYFIKGVGSDRTLRHLDKLGANTVRIWDVGEHTKAILDEAHAKGLTVCVGIWLPHERQGFDYADEQAVEDLMGYVRKAVETYKDHPAVLMWGIGNEMEGYAEEKPLIYKAVNRAAEIAKSIDPNHPTMTVLAELGPEEYKVRSLKKYCPAIDIVGINAYGGINDLGERYVKAGGSKPYIVTEHGPMGHWESPKTDWGLPIEMTSTEKGPLYRRGYASAVLGHPSICLGSFAFLWGEKQEQTATWYGMLLPGGEKLEAVDVMYELWNGRLPDNRVPKIKPIQIDQEPVLGPGATLRASVETSDPESDPVQVKWVLREATTRIGEAGEPEDRMRDVPDAVTMKKDGSAAVRVPLREGPYRLFAYAYDGQGGAAVANIALLVKQAPDKAALEGGEKLPFAVYREGKDGEHYAASGYMGAADNIHMDLNSTDKPHAGKRCIRVAYTAAGDWGGVVWQDPADDWGEKPGGYNLNGAKQLSFWARGAAGGEVVNFGFGVLKEDAKYRDSAGGKLDNVRLTREWKRYTIDLAGKDLTQIKTGFFWSLAGNGKGVVFFLDDIVFETAGD